jgi:hypothetical protein
VANEVEGVPGVGCIAVLMFDVDLFPLLHSTTTQLFRQESVLLWLRSALGQGRPGSWS